MRTVIVALVLLLGAAPAEAAPSNAQLAKRLDALSARLAQTQVELGAVEAQNDILSAMVNCFGEFTIAPWGARLHLAVVSQSCIDARIFGRRTR